MLKTSEINTEELERPDPFAGKELEGEFPVKLPKTGISIEVYDSGRENMGLEKYGMAVFPETTQTEPITCIMDGNKPRYVTGLDEFAPSVRAIKNPKEKAARIKEIRKVVAYLERILNSNIINPDDKDFWKKVETLGPHNSEFWEKAFIKVSNEPVYLNVQDNPMDLVRYYAAKNGGYSIIAKSWDDARTSAKPPKWYLKELNLTVVNKNESRKLRNKALSLLDDLYGKDKKRLMLVAKLSEIYGQQYNYNTPADVLYEQMDNFILGKGGDKNAVRAAQTFITHAERNMEDLKIRALCKDAGYFKVIISHADGHLYHAGTNSRLGRNLFEVVEYFKNPVNSDITERLLEEVERYWNE